MTAPEARGAAHAMAECVPHRSIGQYNRPFRSPRRVMFSDLLTAIEEAVELIGRPTDL